MCATDIKALLKYKDNLKMPYETIRTFLLSSEIF